MSRYNASTKGKPTAAEGHRTRRAALRALAGASALAIPSIGITVSALGDPIFAAIARHKAAYEAREATRFAMDDVINTREASQAEWDAYDRAHENEDAAFDALLTAPPETSLGMRAIIAHLISIDDGRLSQEMMRLLALLQNSPALAA